MPKRIYYQNDDDGFVPKIDHRGGARVGAGRIGKNKIVHKGKEYKFHEILKLAKVPSSVLSDRLYRKWPLQKALNTPAKSYKQHVSCKDAIEIYQYKMRRFLTKHQRLESYKRLIIEMKEQRMKKAA